MKAVPDSEVAYIITMANLCQGMHALPRAGGVLDQDPVLIMGMHEVMQAEAERAERKNASSKP